MKVVAVIPARFGATRFPGKLLKKLGEHSVIATTYLAVKNSGLFDEVIVAADDEKIIQDIEGVHGKAVMTSSNHASGSDRIAEVIQDMDVDVIVNVQGDEPFTATQALASLIDVFKNDHDKKVDVATLMEKLELKEDVQNPNNVKVVVGNNMDALYFSRSAIPFVRDENVSVDYFKHVGIYAYRKKALMAFTQLEPGTLEMAEKLEQLRYLENGYRIKVVETQYKTIGIDTPEDLEEARVYLGNLEQ
ncbi:3-deoxy-manno-octulosonate cytidylyltransferase [Weeksellaceae bacterium KMM 9713]|uniref:3-deoxy-manno-octulosonate cytidylyltransferase n=1 Tax=Profundicola chukchiensis TaxID=2961959 RepID=A0A9X4MXF7_9FLAO|nr:3-deoxy-manno-octulosonate cytidylyltransferase [Profundicola chukchiensis]MDG4946673.1 3-deoxy-manno-octulosonate cytidylyltransferase [Profundicola chukchiensis]